MRQFGKYTDTVTWKGKIKSNVFMHVHKVSPPQEMHNEYTVTERGDTQVDIQNKRIWDELEQ